MPDASAPLPLERTARIFNPKSSLYPFKREVVLTTEQKSKIIQDLDRCYKGWDEDIGLLRSQLQRWINNSEGISEPTQTPWDGASDLYKPITETRMNITHAFWMSIIRPRVGRMFKCTTDNLNNPDEVKLASSIEAWFNNNRAFNLMYLQSSSESFTAVIRDGTVGRSLDWSKKVEKKWEIKTYQSDIEFLKENPDAKSLGMKEEKFAEILEKLKLGPVSIDVDEEVVTEDMPVIDTEEIKDVVMYPLTVSRQERTRLMGRRFWLRESELREREKRGIYKDVDDVVKNKPSEERDQVSTFQDSVEGVTSPNEKMDYAVIQCRYLYDYDDDGIEEKLLIAYAPESKTLLQHDKYPFYHNDDFIKLSRFKIRPKRLLGRGVCQMLDDLNTEANIQSRFRINSMSIQHAPMFKMDEALKGKLDLRRTENKIRPGGVWYVPANSFDKVKEVEMGKRNFQDLFREEAFINQAADNLLGASELRSGRETPNDPRAPASKTALLLQQSATRLDDFIFNVILTENEVLDNCLRLTYQFGPDLLKTYVQNGDQYLPVEIKKSELGKGSLHLQLSVTSLLDNPEYLSQKWEEIYAKFGPEPLVGALLPVRWEILNNIFLNKPETTGKKILLPLEQIQKLATQSAPAPGAGGEAGTKPGASKPPAPGAGQ